MLGRDPERKPDLMPHFKCTACKTRLHSPQTPANQVGDLCPGCGSPLEPVGELAEIVGFQAINPHATSHDGAAPSTHERLAERIGNLLAHRDAILAQAQGDTGPWVDDGSSCADAAFLPRPETHS
jgi:hypothetical protein